MIRLCRRIAVLSESGEHEEAEQVRAGELATALLALRTTAGVTAAEIDRELASIFAAEQERVAHAAVLAEMLAPLLRDRLAASAATIVPHPALPSETSPALTAAPRASSGDITDFIDEMLAQERAQPGPGDRRRAS